MKEILEQAIQGESSALREIYSGYKKAIYYFCLKLMSTPTDAAEMCAETFDQAFARLDTLEDPDQFDIWLKNMAAIRCYNYIHKMKPMLFLQAVADTEELLFSEAELEEMPKGELEETKTCQLMDEMLNRLNDAQRMTLMFHYYNGLSVVQIAKVMGCTADIVKQRMTKAAEHMKNTISALAEREIVLKQVEFRTALGLMAACQNVPQFVDAQVEGIILSISGETPTETPAAPQYNFESFSAPVTDSIEDIAPSINIEEEPSLKSIEVKVSAPRPEKKVKSEGAVVRKIKALSSMQQSVALVVIVAIIATIIIGVGVGKSKGKKNPDLEVPSTVTSSAVSKTSSVEFVIPKYEVTFSDEKQEVKAEDGKVVARASYQLPKVELTESAVAAIKINEFFEEEKQSVLATYSDEAVQQECIYGYENAPHGPWQLNETKAQLESGKVNEATVNILKTTTEFKYGNVYAQDEVEAYCFSSVDGTRLDIGDVMEDKNGYLEYASAKVKEILEGKQADGEYNLYSDYATTVDEVLEQEGRWYFTDKGITVIFNPDEVVYITLGVQKVELPLTEISEFLKQEYRK